MPHQLQFKSLAASSHGRALREYIENLIEEITDIRTIKTVTLDEVNARKIAAEILDERLLQPLSKDYNQSITKPKEVSEFE